MKRFRPGLLLLAFVATFSAAFCVLGIGELALRAFGFRFSLPIVEELSARKMLVPSGPGLVRIPEDLAESVAYGYALTVLEPKGPFPIKKDPSKFRVVLVADSTGAVFNSQKQILVNCLKESLGKEIEFINLSFVGCGSERTLSTVREAFSIEPDALIVATGHSDFVSQCNQRAWGKNGYPVLSRYSELFREAFMRLRVLQLFAKTSTVAARLYMSSEEKRNQVAQVQRAFSAEEKAEFHRAFEENIRAMAREAKSKGIPFYLSTMVYNYEVPPPFETNQPEEYRKTSVVLENFRRGQQLRALGKVGEAQKLLDDAFAQSARPMAVSVQMNELIRKVAREESAHLIDIKRAVDDQSKDRMAGNALMIDHCHVNEKGNLILAREFCSAISRK